MRRGALVRQSLALIGRRLLRIPRGHRMQQLPPGRASAQRRAQKTTHDARPSSAFAVALPSLPMMMRESPGGLPAVADVSTPRGSYSSQRVGSRMRQEIARKVPSRDELRPRQPGECSRAIRDSPAPQIRPSRTAQCPQSGAGGTAPAIGATRLGPFVSGARDEPFEGARDQHAQLQLGRAAYGADATRRTSLRSPQTLPSTANAPWRKRKRAPEAPEPGPSTSKAAKMLEPDAVSAGKAECVYWLLERCAEMLRDPGSTSRWTANLSASVLRPQSRCWLAFRS